LRTYICLSIFIITHIYTHTRPGMYILHFVLHYETLTSATCLVCVSLSLSLSLSPSPSLFLSLYFSLSLPLSISVSVSVSISMSVPVSVSISVCAQEPFASPTATAYHFLAVCVSYLTPERRAFLTPRCVKL